MPDNPASTHINRATKRILAMAGPLIHALACPNCYLADRVQKVSAIVRAGKWHGDLSGTTLGPEGEENVVLQSENISELARLLAPPEKPKQAIPSWFIRIARYAAIVAIALIAGLALVQLAVEWLFSTSQPPQTKLLLWQIASVATIYCLLFFGARAWRNARIRTYKQAMKKWKNSYYCHRCDSIFILKPPDATAPGDFAEWLYA